MHLVMGKMQMSYEAIRIIQIYSAITWTRRIRFIRVVGTVLFKIALPTGRNALARFALKLRS